MCTVCPVTALQRGHTVPTLLSSHSRRGAKYEQVSVTDRTVTRISKLEVVRPGISEEVIIERDGKEKPWEDPGQQKREPRAPHMRDSQDLRQHRTPASMGDPERWQRGRSRVGGKECGLNRRAKGPPQPQQACTRRGPKRFG